MFRTNFTIYFKFKDLKFVVYHYMFIIFKFCSLVCELKEKNNPNLGTEKFLIPKRFEQNCLEHSAVYSTTDVVY